LKKALLWVLRLLPFAIILALMTFVLLSEDEISPEKILMYSPREPLLAAFFLIVMFALKSLSVMLPLAVLFIAGGMLFPLHIALIINTIGVAVAVSIPYFIGRYSGASLANSLALRYPKLEKLWSIRRKSSFFYSFILRVINILPCDIVSIYLGALRTPYLNYLAGCILGYLPYIVAVTVMGTSISDPGSPKFIISLVSALVITAASLIIYKIYRTRLK
jgi:uncharacterized membrane protein YdjX (TVP38/TMEM64 family)